MFLEVMNILKVKNCFLEPAFGVKGGKMNYNLHFTMEERSEVNVLVVHLSSTQPLYT